MNGSVFVKIVSYVLEDGQPPILLDDYLTQNAKKKMPKERIVKMINLLNDFMVFYGVKLKLSKTNVKNRTALQNNSIHLLYSKTATVLNDAGLDMKKAIQAELDWKMESVKEYVWRPIQIATVDKTSTTQLTTKEVDEVYDEYNKYLSKLGVHVPFQCVENMIFEQLELRAI